MQILVSEVQSTETSTTNVNGNDDVPNYVWPLASIAFLVTVFIILLLAVVVVKGKRKKTTYDAIAFNVIKNMREAFKCSCLILVNLITY